MSQNTYEFIVVDSETGEVNNEWTMAYNDYLIYEDVEGMNLPKRFRVKLRNK